MRANKENYDSMPQFLFIIPQYLNNLCKFFKKFFIIQNLNLKMIDNDQAGSLFAKSEAQNRNETNKFAKLKPVAKKADKQKKNKKEPMDELQKLFAARGQLHQSSSSSSEKSCQNSNSIHKNNGSKDVKEERSDQKSDQPNSMSNQDQNIQSLFAANSKVQKREQKSVQSTEGSISHQVAPKNGSEDRQVFDQRAALLNEAIKPGIQIIGGSKGSNQKRQVDKNYRRSVRDNIAFFETMSRGAQGENSQERPPGQQSKDLLQNKANEQCTTEEVKDNRSSSVKDLALFFGNEDKKGEKQSGHESANDKNYLKEKLYPKNGAKFASGHQKRQSMGDAFLAQINKQIESEQLQNQSAQEEFLQNQMGGTRQRTNSTKKPLTKGLQSQQQRDSSLGDAFLASIQKEAEERELEQNQEQKKALDAERDSSKNINNNKGLLSAKKGNIFNKQRAQRAAQKFSVHSEGQPIIKRNIFRNQTNQQNNERNDQTEGCQDDDDATIQKQQMENGDGNLQDYLLKSLVPEDSQKNDQGFGQNLSPKKKPKKIKNLELKDKNGSDQNQESLQKADIIIFKAEERSEDQKLNSRLISPQVELIDFANLQNQDEMQISDQNLSEKPINQNQLNENQESQAQKISSKVAEPSQLADILVYKPQTESENENNQVRNSQKSFENNKNNQNEVKISNKSSQIDQNSSNKDNFQNNLPKLSEDQFGVKKPKKLGKLKSLEVLENQKSDLVRQPIQQVDSPKIKTRSRKLHNKFTRVLDKLETEETIGISQSTINQKNLKTFNQHLRSQKDTSNVQLDDAQKKDKPSLMSQSQATYRFDPQGNMISPHNRDIQSTFSNSPPKRSSGANNRRQTLKEQNSPPMTKQKKTLTSQKSIQSKKSDKSVSKNSSNFDFLYKVYAGVDPEKQFNRSGNFQNLTSPKNSNNRMFKQQSNNLTSNKQVEKVEEKNPVTTQDEQFFQIHSSKEYKSSIGTNKKNQFDVSALTDQVNTNLSQHKILESEGVQIQSQNDSLVDLDYEKQQFQEVNEIESEQHEIENQSNKRNSCVKSNIQTEKTQVADQFDPKFQSEKKQISSEKCSLDKISAGELDRFDNLSKEISYPDNSKQIEEQSNGSQSQEQSNDILGKQVENFIDQTQSEKQSETLQGIENEQMTASDKEDSSLNSPKIQIQDSSKKDSVHTNLQDESNEEEEEDQINQNQADSKYKDEIDKSKDLVSQKSMNSEQNYLKDEKAKIQAEAELIEQALRNMESSESLNDSKEIVVQKQNSSILDEKLKNSFEDLDERGQSILQEALNDLKSQSSTSENLLLVQDNFEKDGKSSESNNQLGQDNEIRSDDYLQVQEENDKLAGSKALSLANFLEETSESSSSNQSKVLAKTESKNLSQIKEEYKDLVLDQNCQNREGLDEDKIDDNEGLQKYEKFQLTLELAQQLHQAKEQMSNDQDGGSVQRQEEQVIDTSLPISNVQPQNHQNNFDQFWPRDSDREILGEVVLPDLEPQNGASLEMEQKVKGDRKFNNEGYFSPIMIQRNDVPVQSELRPRVLNRDSRAGKTGVQNQDSYIPDINDVSPANYESLKQLPGNSTAQRAKSGMYQRLITPELEITDPSDLDRLQKNYMNNSSQVENAQSQRTEDKSVQNMREKQLKFEVEILELELELQMNEEEMLSDEDADNLTNKLIYVKAPQSASKKLMQSQVPLQDPKMSSFASVKLPSQQKLAVSSNSKEVNKMLLTSPGKQQRETYEQRNILSDGSQNRLAYQNKERSSCQRIQGENFGTDADRLTRLRINEDTVTQKSISSIKNKLFRSNTVAVVKNESSTTPQSDPLKEERNSKKGIVYLKNHQQKKQVCATSPGNLRNQEDYQQLNGVQNLQGEQRDEIVLNTQEVLVLPINFEDQEVLCSNCYETFPMSQVDTHSAICYREQKRRLETTLNQSMRSHQRCHDNHNQSFVHDMSLTLDEELLFEHKLAELNERILKLILTFQRKLEDQNFLDHILYPSDNEQDENGEDGANFEDEAHQQQFWDQERGGPSRIGQGNLQQSKRNKAMQIRQMQVNAAKIAEERALIHKVIRKADKTLQNDLEVVKKAVDKLEELEEDHDLNQKFDFNNHLLFNRILQNVTVKLEELQLYEYNLNPNGTLPMTKRQIQQIEQKCPENGQNQLSIENVKKIGYTDLRREHLKLVSSQNSSINSHQIAPMTSKSQKVPPEQALLEIVTQQKVKAMQKKRTIFERKGEASQVENWVISDLGSDQQSIDANSDMNSMSSRNFGKGRFQAQAKLKKQQI